MEVNYHPSDSRPLTKQSQIYIQHTFSEGHFLMNNILPEGFVVVSLFFLFVVNR